MPEGGMEEIGVNFWVHLGIGGSEDISDCDGQAVKELIDDYVGSDVGRVKVGTALPRTDGGNGDRGLASDL